MNQLADAARDFDLTLTQTQLEAFALFEKRLYDVNELLNLTRIPQEECWSKHFLDSLTLSPLIPGGATVLDIGTGPGAPGVCLAIARPDLVVSVMDGASKEVAFLAGLFGPTGPLPVLFQIIQARAEDAGKDPKLRETFDFVTGRALAPLSMQAELSAPFVKIGGLFVPMRTPSDKEAARFPCHQLGLKLTDEHHPVLKPIGATRYLPVFKKTGATRPLYPRPWAQIRNKPL